MDKEKHIIIIPVSPLEAHGPHLPVGADILITEEICKELSKKLRKKRKSVFPVIYPAQMFGYCGANKDVAGSVSVDVRCFADVMRDTLKSLAMHGFRFIMIITFHLDPFHIKAIHSAIRKVETAYQTRVAEPVSKYFYLNGDIDHAGKEETSIMLYLYPYLVDKIYKSLKEVKISPSIWNLRKTFREVGVKDAYTGNPSEATMEDGRKLFRNLLEFCTQSALELIDGKYENYIPGKLRYLPLFLQRK